MAATSDGLFHEARHTGDGGRAAVTPSANARPLGELSDLERHAIFTAAGPLASDLLSGGNDSIRLRPWIVAGHEAAHAAVAYVLGFRLGEVSIERLQHSAGHMTLSHQVFEDHPVATDREKVNEITRWIWTDSDRSTPLGDTRLALEHQAAVLIGRCWAGIRRLSEALLERGRIDGAEAERILAAAGVGPAE